MKVVSRILLKLRCCREKTLFPDEHISASSIFISADCESDFKICWLKENIEQTEIYAIFMLSSFFLNCCSPRASYRSV